MLFIDDFSRYVWIYPLKQKSDVLVAFNHFLASLKTQFNAVIKALHVIDEGEYSGKFINNATS